MENIKSKTYKKIMDFAVNYKIFTLDNLKAMFPYISDQHMMMIVKTLTYKGLLSYRTISQNNRYTSIYSTSEFNPDFNTEIYGNSFEAITKSISTLAELKKYYSVAFHKLCYFPSTIKLSVIIRGEERNFEICYLPYSEDNSVVKKVGYYFDDAYDERFDVERILICEKPYQFLDETSRNTIEQHIHRIKNYAFVNVTHDVQFYSF